MFDPACGCGNFLIIAYRELRELECGSGLPPSAPSGRKQESSNAAALDDTGPLSRELAAYVAVSRSIGVEPLASEEVHIVGKML
ncbi:MAG: hypothetical protein F4Y86_19420 [Gammaproteobacteria bacterium]|nr:hypothetical protein [Gammaproteobacteria bacterium]